MRDIRNGIRALAKTMGKLCAHTKIYAAVKFYEV